MPTRIRDRLLADLAVELDSAGSFEGSDESQRFVHRDGERVHVRAAVELRVAAQDLLGRHVGRRPEDVARLRQRRDVGLLVARQSEVEQDRLAVAADHHVSRLHVAVDDAGLVRRVERARDPLEEEQHAADVERAHGRPRRRHVALGGVDRVLRVRTRLLHPRLREDLRQRSPFDVAHRDVGLVRFDVGVVDPADSGMLEACDDLGLAAEAPATILRDEIEARREHLERHAARDPRVLGEEDRTLSASPDLGEDAVRADARPRVFRARRARGGNGRSRLVRTRALESQVLARDRLLAARVAGEVVSERPLPALLAIGQELVDEVEDVGCFGVFAPMHRNRL